MLKLILFLIFSFSINVFADINLSSPKLSLNQSGERVIEFKIQDGKVEDSDIFLNEYKSAIFFITIVLKMVSCLSNWKKSKLRVYF